MYSSYYSAPTSMNRYRDSGYRSSSSRFLESTSRESSSINRYRPPLPTPAYKPLTVNYFSSSFSSQVQPSSTRSRFLPNNNVDDNFGSRQPFRRGVSLSPAALDSTKYRENLTPIKSLIRSSFNNDSSSRSLSGFVDSGYRPRRSVSVHKERTRDELIDSIIHTRTREHRVMPGFHNSTCWEERKIMQIDCDKVFPGICLANGETIKNISYLKKIGTTHVLNTAERHVVVNPATYPLHGISYFGFHVDDHPSANISRFFARTTDFIDEAVRGGGLVVVNCVMGWSRSASVVAAYLMMKQKMSSAEALELIRQSRPIRPNPGFLDQLASHENLLNKKPYWD